MDRKDLTTRLQVGHVRGRGLYVAWLFLVMLMTVGGLTVHTFFAYRRAAAELILERDRQVAYLSASRLRSELNRFSDTLMALARTPNLTSTDATVQRTALVQALPLREGMFDGGLIMFDNFGTVVATAPERPEIIGADWSDRDSFRLLLSAPAPIFTNASTDGPDGALVVGVTVPVFGANGQFAGGLMGLLRLGQSTISPFYASIVRLRIGQTGTTYVIDGSDKILFDSSSEAVGLAYSVYELPNQVFDPQGGVVRTRDASQNDIVAAYAPVAGTPWTLVIEDDWNTLTWETRRYVNLLLWLVGLGMTLPLIGAAVLIGQRNADVSEQRDAEREKRMARLIKDTLLPDHPPLLPGWNVIIHYEAGPTVSGGFHDTLLLPDGQLMLTVGRVEAMDIAGTLMLATVRATLRGTARCQLTPAEAMARSNEFLCPELSAGATTTCFYGLLDPTTATLRYGGAGEYVACHVSSAGVSALQGGGEPLGVGLDSRYGEREVVLQPDEFILLGNTDLVNRLNEAGEVFGVERLHATVRHAGDATSAVAAMRIAMREFTRGSQFEDASLTLIVLERLDTEAHI